MSQRHFNYGPFQVLTGWDRPLQYHFLVVSRGDGLVFSNLDLPNPAMTPEQVVAKLGELDLLMPATLLADLRQDAARNSGNESTQYEPFTKEGV